MSFSLFTRPFAWLLFVLALLLVTSLAPRAQAENAGPDRVTLRNGKTFQGTMQLVEVDAAYVKMTLDDGKVITIPSKEIARIERTAPDLVALPAAPTPHEDAGVVHVSFHADPEVVLQARGRTDRSWRVICRQDCEEELPLEDQYQVAGGGMRTTKPFGLTGKNGDRVVLDLERHSRSQFGAGVTLLTLSSVTLLASFVHENDCEEHSVCGHSFGGWAANTVVSLAANAFGTALIALNPHSKVMQRIKNGTNALLTRAISRPSIEPTPASREPVAWHRSSLPVPSSAQTSTLLTLHF